MDMRMISEELGVSPAAAEKIMRQVEKIHVPGLRKVYVRRVDVLDLLDTLNEKWTLPPADKALLQEIVDKIKRRKVGHTLLPIAKNAIEAELLRIKSATIKHLAVIAGCSEDHARKIVRDLGCHEVGKKGKEKLWALPETSGTSEETA